MQTAILGFFALLSLSVLGCSGSDETSSLGSGSPSGKNPIFDPPPSGKSATPDSVFGLWGGAIDRGGIKFDTRFKLTSSSMTAATRCIYRDGTPTLEAQVTVAARVTEEEIATLESDVNESVSGKATCRTEVDVVERKRCASDAFQKTECFELAGRKLTFYGKTPLESTALTKLSD
jgi:hypothetical protein